MPGPDLALTADEARRIALRAQGLLGAEGRKGGVAGVLERLGALQIDTISVLARSHELVPYARLGAVGRDRVERALWGRARPAATFEYWAHAACVLPADRWPLFAFRRRWYRARGMRWHAVPHDELDAVLARVREDGPLTANDLGGAKRGGPWWDWSSVKVAIEWLLDIGEVVCVQRRGFQRIYDVPERAIAPELLAADLDDETCLTALVGIAGRALGVATRKDLADYHRLKVAEVARVVRDSGLVEVPVEGWPAPVYADPSALAAGPARGHHRTTLLSPFDSLVWDRARTERVFGFVHRLEAYVPKPKRVHGYFAMPLLTGGRLAGRVDPAREGSTLIARQLSLEPDAVDAMAQALREAAAWVGCDAVALERVDPPGAAKALRAALS